MNWDYATLLKNLASFYVMGGNYSQAKTLLQEPFLTVALHLNHC